MHDDHDPHGGHAAAGETPASEDASKILGRPPLIYFCHESLYRVYVDRMESWQRNNLDPDAHAAREHFDPHAEESAAVRTDIAERINAADVIICVIAQSSFIDEWIDWELRLAVAREPRPGIVGIFTQEHVRRPPAIDDIGAIFVPFRRDMLERAAAWSLTEHHTTGNFTVSED